MDDADCRDLSEYLAVLANPFRIRILCVLAEGEEPVGSIATAVGLPSPHVSAHLRVLYDRGYLSRRREWKQVFYSLRDPAISRLIGTAAALARSARD